MSPARTADRPRFTVRTAPLPPEPYPPAGRGAGRPAPREPRSGRTELNLLGPLEVLHRGRRPPLGSRRVRTVLGYLLLRSNEAVSADELTAALWPEDAPLTAPRMVSGAVSALHSALPAVRAGVPLPPARRGDRGGWLIEAAPHEVDLLRFRRRAARGERQLADRDWPGAARTLRRALDLWRGDVLADLAPECAHWPESDAVREERWAARLAAVTADLALGRDHDVVRELMVHAEEQPLRPRLTALLMVALYRVGRQVDALDVYHRAREAGAHRTGHRPGRELRLLQQAVLTHDPALLGPGLPVSAAFPGPGCGPGT
ncbi:BTAD domain-containing putative transcriptional regulator [Streptomyces sp. NPDC094448]|uniref:AfsR/SARP family transcriptional regulator n=1 Tax=Streptomyces sp. NPDC094448 TaxID=3366063 RepID=UPI00381D9985